ncbi:MAG: proline dehydrogenase family protein [Bacteroidetes bacterium]|nr:proline dehydrogenase family protein [Bacteroidota bacterium]
MESPPKLSFDNLENSFAFRSTHEIRRAYWLFKAISFPSLVKVGSNLATGALKYHLPVKGLIRATIFRHFCGGEDINDCARTIERLGLLGVGSILDYSVEGKEDEVEFDHSCQEILSTVKRAQFDPNIPFSVFKVTGLGRIDLLEKVSNKAQLSSEEAAEYSRVKERVRKICEEGFQLNVRVFIDAEETWIQPAIDDMTTQMMEKYNKEKAIIYNTVQLYRHDRLEFVKTSHQRAVEGSYFLGLKLVRGAYMEKERERATTNGYPSPIHADKAASDKDYDAALRYCVQHIDRIAICAGTHNENSSLLLTRLMAENNISPNDERIYFSQLLGMSDHISFNLAKAGYRIAKYVPYGPVAAVLPYLTRRAQENTSIAGQMGRELSLLTAELRRRKK